MYIFIDICTSRAVYACYHHRYACKYFNYPPIRGIAGWFRSLNARFSRTIKIQSELEIATCYVEDEIPQFQVFEYIPTTRGNDEGYPEMKLDKMYRARRLDKER